MPGSIRPMSPVPVLVPVPAAPIPILGIASDILRGTLSMGISFGLPMVSMAGLNSEANVVFKQIALISNGLEAELENTFPKPLVRSCILITAIFTLQTFGRIRYLRDPLILHKVSNINRVILLYGMTSPFISLLSPPQLRDAAMVASLIFSSCLLAKELCY